MKARLICRIRRHEWRNGSNDYEHQTVWSANAAESPKATRETPGVRAPDWALPRGAVILAAEACRTNRGSGVDRVCISPGPSMPSWPRSVGRALVDLLRRAVRQRNFEGLDVVRSLDHRAVL